MISLQTYQLRLKAFFEKKSKSESNYLKIYFKGEHGFTQPINIPLNRLIDNFYKCEIELIDVGNLSYAHIKLDGKDVRLKLNSVEVERDESKIFHFPIDRWLHSNGPAQLDVLVNQGPIELDPIYTVTVHKGSISSSTQASIRFALIGTTSSSLPFILNTTTASTQPTASKTNFFQSGSQDTFFVSPMESMDIGQLCDVQFWCDTTDKLPYYCESVEVTNNFTNDKYFFLINHWFGPDLEQQVCVPVTNRSQESKVFTISVKTMNISDTNKENTLLIQMRFANDKIYEETLNSSETYQIPFQADHIDFFVISLNDVGNSQIIDAKICLINKLKEVQWVCSWIEIRDVFYQRTYYYKPRKILKSNSLKNSSDYVPLEKITSLS
ncbi:unnamed protein product [Adineta ricciae]|uniref:PLAT domain-containing protein n=1 Tax=Adineta ricciae TaxID=249248 RepID=A0A815D809_ADIRI|nr:unnamed protein product [Adineta ricciae]